MTYSPEHDENALNSATAESLLRGLEVEVAKLLIEILHESG